MKVVLTLTFLSLYCAAFSSVPDPKLTIGFYCGPDLNESDSPTLSRQDLELALIENAEGELVIDSTQLEQFNQQLRESPYDYFDCLADIYDDLEYLSGENELAQGLMQDLYSGDESLIENINLVSIRNEWIELMSDYGEFVDANPYPTPFIFGDPLRTITSDNQLRRDVMERNLENGSGLQCFDKDALKNIAPENLHLFYDIAQGHPDCLEIINREVAYALALNQRTPEECAIIGQSLCDRLNQASLNVLSSLQGIDPLAEYLQDLNEISCMSISDQHVLNFTSLISDILEAPRCTQLAAGESEEIDLNYDFISTPTRYRLMREKDEQDRDIYTADVNINFNFTSDQVNPEEFQRHIDKCLENSQGALTGPDGEVFNIRVNSGQSSAQAYDIRVAPPTEITRANALGYPSNIDCSTIIHELLHLLGLVDTYREAMLGVHHDISLGTLSPTESPQYATQEDNYEYRYSCRAHAPVNNIMHNQRLNLEGGNYLEPCTCDPSASEVSFRACANDLTELMHTRSESPEGNHQCPESALDSNASTFPIQEQARFRARELGISNGVYHIPRQIDPNDQSLSPAEFRMLTNPGCNTPETNQLYRYCAQFAYITRREGFGEGCAGRLPICDSEAWLE